MAKEGQRRRVRMWAGAFRTPMGNSSRYSRSSIPADEVLTGEGGTPAYRGRKAAAAKKGAVPAPSKKRRKNGRRKGLERIEPTPKPKAVARPKNRTQREQGDLQARVARIEGALTRLRQLPSFTLDEAAAAAGEHGALIKSILAAQVDRGRLRVTDDDRYEWSG